MAIATNTRAAHSGLRNDLSALILHAYQGLVDRRAYRRTIAELSALSTNELADLGMTRSSITSVARKAVYGTRG